MKNPSKFAKAVFKFFKEVKEFMPPRIDEIDFLFYNLEDFKKILKKYE